MKLSNQLTDKLKSVSVMKITVFVLAAIVVGGCAVAYAITSDNNDVLPSDTNEQMVVDAEETLNELKVESIEFAVNDIEIPWKDMGYASFKEYQEDMLALHEGAKGMAENAIAKYSSVITDEQKNLLKQYEETMVNCMSHDQYEETIGKFNEIVSALESKLNPPKVETKPVQSSKPVNPETNDNASGDSSSSSGDVYTGSYNDFMRDGIIYHKGNKFTYYSEQVLPGGGLKIPGRHTSGGFVRDGDGYIVLANDKPNGTVVETPWGMGKVYDKGTYGNHYDIYVA